jgi:hypothetical protein
LFYQTCKVIADLSLGYHTPYLLPHVRPRDTNTTPVEITPYTKRIFLHLPEGYLGLLRRFRVDGSVVCPAVYADTRWNIDLDWAKNQIHISVGQAKRYKSHVPDGFEAGRNVIEEAMRAEVETIMTRDGQRKPRCGELEAFCRMFILVDGK